MWAVGARADAEVYAEAAARVREADARRPEFQQLSEVIERFGRLVSDINLPDQEQGDPVPDWLANRLIHTASMRREEVATLTLEEAVDRWAAFTARPREN